MDFIKELEQRGMVQDVTPDLSKALEKRVKGYIGFDPTAPSLHIGNLATLMLLVHLNRAGHQPIVVLGGATGLIGDPSFKSQERKFLDEKTLLHHQHAIAVQMKKLLEAFGVDDALILNNYDWYKEMNVLSFLRQAGKFISVNYMMGKDSVKNRLEDGISYTEFAYQLLQAYDFYHLHTQHDVHLQMGGADQWGNLTTGIELIRKKAGKAAHALTTPLITKADGTKFGKTEAGNIWLDAKLTSPYHFYQFWLNCSDAEAPMLLKRMTLHRLNQIEAWAEEHAQAPHKRILQKRLAEALTSRIHTEEICHQVIHASEILFGEAPLGTLSELEESLVEDIFAQLPEATLTAEALQKTDSLLGLLTFATDHLIFSSKREAREIIQAGGLRLNKVKVTEAHTLPPLTWILGRYLLIQKGKKQYYLIRRL